MDSLLAQVKTFENAIPPERLSALATVFPLKHFKTLLSEEFRFYSTGFWYSLDAEPANVFESVISSLLPLADPSARVTGVEWWFSVLRTNASPHWLLPCHFDRNDLMEKNIHNIKHPEKASVLFLNTVPYGELVVTDQVLTRSGTEPKQPRDMLFIKPQQNLYAVFPGGLYHGVIGRMWRPAQKPKLRLAMAVNWWHEKPKAAYLSESRDCGAVLRLPM